MPSLNPKLRTSLSIILVGALGLLATGCSSSAANSTTYQIRVWRYNQDIDPLRDTFSEFEQTYPDAKITYENHTLDTYETDALASLASQTGPELWSIPNDWLGDEESRLVPLPANYFQISNSKTYDDPVTAVKNIYPPNIASALIDDGNVYGLASNVDLLRMYYNPALFSQATSDYVSSLGQNASQAETQPVETLLSNPPTTWTQLLQQLPYLTQKSGTTITRSAIALGTADNVPDAGDTLALLMYQNGATIVSSDRTQALFGDQITTSSGAIIRPGETALQFLTQFSSPSSSAYTWNPSMPDALDAFGEGKVAMVIAYSDFGSEVKAKYPQLSYGTAVVPQINTTDPAVNLVTFSVDGVTKAASNQSLALKLLYQTDVPNSVDNLAEESGLRSPYISTLQSQASNDITSKSILTAETVYKKDHAQFDADFLQMIRDVSQNGATVASALNEGVQNIDNLLTPPLPTPSPTDND